MLGRPGTSAPSGCPLVSGVFSLRHLLTTGYGTQQPSLSVELTVAIGGAADSRNVRHAWGRAYSGLIPANLITLPNFSISSEISLPNSAGELASATPPKSVIRDMIFGSVRPILISLLSLSMNSTGVFLGAPMPCQPPAS